MPYGAAIFDQWAEQDLANSQIRQQEIARKKQEREHSKSWWKRGIGQGLLGALPGIVTLNPIQAAAGAAGGFGGEAVNHYAFKDKHPEIAGSAAALASLGSGAATKGLFQQAGNKVGLEGLQRTANNMGNNAAYNAEIAKVATPAFNSSGVAMPQTTGGTPITPQTTGANPAGYAQSMGPSTALANPKDLAFGQVSSDLQNLSQEELMRRLQLYGFDSLQGMG